MARQNLHLSDQQLHEIEEKLLLEKCKLLNKKTDQDSFCLDKNELSDVLDEASINIQASRELRFRNRELFYLKKINKALDRIQRGLYGICEDCDDQISYDRLIARPTAELCIMCKEEAELSEKNNVYLRKSKSYGQTLSEIGKR